MEGLGYPSRRSSDDGPGKEKEFFLTSYATEATDTQKRTTPSAQTHRQGN